MSLRTWLFGPPLRAPIIGNGYRPALPAGQPSGPPPRGASGVMPPPAVDQALRRALAERDAENERLREENGKLRAALRVNAMRYEPSKTHAEIDAAIAAALGGVS